MTIVNTVSSSDSCYIPQEEETGPTDTDVSINLTTLVNTVSSSASCYIPQEEETGPTDTDVNINLTNLVNTVSSSASCYIPQEEETGPTDTDVNINLTNMVNTVSSSASCYIPQEEENLTADSVVNANLIDLSTPCILNLSKNKPISCLQVTPEQIEIESKVLRMVKDIHTDEVRIPVNRLNKSKKGIIKNITDEFDLSSFKHEKDNSKCLVLRKKPKNKEQQIADYERKLMIENEKLRLMKEFSKIQIIKEPTKGQMVSSACQFDEMDTKKSKQARRRRREEARRQQKIEDEIKKVVEKPPLIETHMQTCGEEFYVCCYCGRDVLRDEENLHKPMCRSNLRYLEQLKGRTNKNSSKNTKSSSDPKFPIVIKLKHRIEHKPAAEKTKTNKRQKVITEKINSIHPNDIDGLGSALRKICAVKDCADEVKGKCKTCQKPFCLSHLGEDKSCQECSITCEKNEEYEKKYEVYQGQLKEAMRNRLKNLRDRRSRY